MMEFCENRNPFFQLFRLSNIRTCLSSSLDPRHSFLLSTPVPLFTIGIVRSTRSLIGFFSVDPPLLLESGLELIGDFLRGLLGPTIDLAAAARFPVHLHPATYDEAQRVSGGNGNAKRHSGTRTFASAGFHLARSELARALSRHLIAFNRHAQTRRSGTESDRHAFRGAALLDREEIASDQDVVDLRLRRSRSPLCGQPHAADLQNQPLRNFSAYP